MKNYLIVFVVCFCLWYVFNFFLNNNKLASDGFFEVGFPFVFYRDFNGKGNYAELNLGLNKINLLLDILIFLFVTIGAYKLLGVIKKK